MSFKKRLAAMALGVCVAAAPVASFAEGNYAAGDLTVTAVSDSYAAGNQLNLGMTFEAKVDENLGSKRAEALAKLAGMARVNASMYEAEDGTHLHGELLMDGVKVFSADAIALADGSTQVMTNLTGKYVLVVPAQGFDIVSGVGELAEGSGDSDAMQRLKETSFGVYVQMMSQMLGWFSRTQQNNEEEYAAPRIAAREAIWQSEDEVDSGEMYVFNNAYLDATDSRDSVSQRMMITVSGTDFMTLIGDAVMTLRDDMGDFQRALADVLAERGVTRKQMREMVDTLFTKETIDPATDWVTPSWSIKNPEDPCELEDIQYLLRKLYKSVDAMWEASSEETMLNLVQSYDDMGNTVGMDIDAPAFIEGSPYAGDFTYSQKTDDNWQVIRTAHGEFQAAEDKRVVGSLLLQDGEDVDGINENIFDITLNLTDARAKGEEATVLVGIGTGAALTFAVDAMDDGRDLEQIEGQVTLSVCENNESLDVVVLNVEGDTVTDGDTFAFTGMAQMHISELGEGQVNITFESTPITEIPFAGGQAVDLSNVTDAQMEQLKNEIIAQGTKLSVSLILHPGVVSTAMTFLGQ